MLQDVASHTGAQHSASSHVLVMCHHNYCNEFYTFSFSNNGCVHTVATCLAEVWLEYSNGFDCLIQDYEDRITHQGTYSCCCVVKLLQALPLLQWQVRIALGAKICMRLHASMPVWSFGGDSKLCLPT